MIATLRRSAFATPGCPDGVVRWSAERDIASVYCTDWTDLRFPRHNSVMPLFEYACRQCGQKFEYLTREGHAPSCPSCEGHDLEKQLSVFAVSAGSSSQDAFSAAPGACGSCGDPRGPGSCSIH